MDIWDMMCNALRYVIFYVNLWKTLRFNTISDYAAARISPMFYCSGGRVMSKIQFMVKTTWKRRTKEDKGEQRIDRARLINDPAGGEFN